jgi:hypothetical protein
LEAGKEETISGRDSKFFEPSIGDSAQALIKTLSREHVLYHVLSLGEEIYATSAKLEARMNKFSQRHLLNRKMKTETLEF